MEAEGKLNGEVDERVVFVVLVSFCSDEEKKGLAVGKSEEG